MYQLTTYEEEEKVEEQVVTYEPPEGHVVDEFGRLMLDPSGIVDPEQLPELDIDAYVSKWLQQIPAAEKDWNWTSRVVWPETPHVVLLRRLDVFEQSNPRLQVGTTDINDSREVRASGNMYSLHTCFYVNFKNITTTIDLCLESTGPPRRSRFRPIDKKNARDLSRWLLMDTISVFNGVSGNPGAVQYYIDFMDFPDRYFLSQAEEPVVGSRRIFHFAGYAAKQYFILEKYIQHEALDMEGGTGYTYVIEVGPILYARKDYRLIGSFFGFEAQLPGSSLYTVYGRSDPFPRMMMTLGVIERSHEWTMPLLTFYAFDVPVPGTVRYTIQHCIRSIYSNQASIPRHKMTTLDPKAPWEFRMFMYVFPATLEDCTILPYPYR